MTGMHHNPPPSEARVPLFGTWRNAYVIVVAVFVVEVALFYALGRFFA
jgi:hypothetical protein